MNTTNVKLSRKQRRNDRKISLGRTRKRPSFLTLLPRFKKLERRGKLRMMPAERKRRRNKRQWKQRRKPLENKALLKLTKR